MKALPKKKNLFLRVVLGFALGVVLGLTAKDFSIANKVAGDIYDRSPHHAVFHGL